MQALRGLALEGGGVLGVAYAGLAKSIQSRGMTHQLTHFAGTSAGAMVAALMACRVPPQDLESFLLSVDFTKLQDGGWCMLSDAYRLWSEYGWYHGDAIRKIYGDFLEKSVGDRHITYRDVHQRFGTTLVTTATELRDGKTIFYSPATTPDVEILDGVHRSSSIPIMYCPIRTGSQCIVDGGVIDNYPIRALYDYLPPDQVFGAKFKGNDAGKSAPVESLSDYVKRLYDLLHEQTLKLHVKDDDWKRTILIAHDGVSPTDFGITAAQRHDLIGFGQKQTDAFLELSRDSTGRPEE